VFVRKTIENRIFSVLIFIIIGLLVFAAIIGISLIFGANTSAGGSVFIGDGAVPLSSSPVTQEEINLEYPIDKSMRNGEPVSYVPVNYADPPWEAVFPVLDEQYEAALALGYEQFDDEKCEYIFNGINEKRTKKLLKPLTYVNSGNLYKLTYIRAVEIVDFYSHERPDGTNALAVMTDQYIGGEILNGQPTLQETLDTWFNSPTHLETILCPQLTEIAVVGIEPVNGENYGRQAALFGIRPCEY